MQQGARGGGGRGGGQRGESCNYSQLLHFSEEQGSTKKTRHIIPDQLAPVAAVEKRTVKKQQDTSNGKKN